MEYDLLRHAVAKHVQQEVPELLPYVDSLMTAARPGVRLKADPVADGRSRLGGTPDMPDGVEWPRGKDGSPLLFVAQVDLSAVPHIDGTLPDHGLLLFFYDDRSWSEGPGSDAHKVMWFPDGERVETPDGGRCYSTVRLSAELTATLPELVPGLPVELDEALWELRAMSGHALLGWASNVQGPVEEEAAYTFGKGDGPDDEFVLLAQFDSDSDAGMMWGDAGTVYWLMRRKDLVGRRWDQAHLIMQCS